MGNTSLSYRSSSAKPSMRSSSSRNTLVGYDASLGSKIDVMYGTSNDIKDFTWSDHLRAVFCISRSRKNKHFQKTTSVAPSGPEDREIRVDSPWVLPVYVLSTERDEHRHLIPKEAKCIIDSGNLQGNIVSRALLVDVLGYSEADFHELTKEEQSGGTGITGHKLIPKGAIYLTWYHSNSTRVFRDMRFLISEHPNYDLIIGARSIRENNILDVPNLMGGALLLNEGPNSERLQTLESEMTKAKEAWQEFMLEGWKTVKPRPKGADKVKLIKEKEQIFDDAAKLYNDERKADYRFLVRKAEKERHGDKASKLRQEYTDWCGETLPTPLPEEEDPKKK